MFHRRDGTPLFLSGQGPREDDGRMYTGKVGGGVTVEDAYLHARLTGPNLRAVLQEALGDLRRVRQQDALAGRPAVRCSVVPDPTQNPLDRLQVAIDPDSRTTAWNLADALAAGIRPVIIRDHEVKHGYFQLDPCNLDLGEAEIVAYRLEELDRARTANVPCVTRLADCAARRLARTLQWPD